MFDLVIEYRVEAQRILSFVLLIAALRWGGAPEKILAVVFVAIFTVPLTAFEILTDSPLMFGGSTIVRVGLDLVALALFMFVALNANRSYPLWVAGFQVVALAAHMVSGIVDVITPLAYAILVIGPSYFQLIFMAVGLMLHIRRKKRYGQYRDWRVPLPYPFGPKQPPDILKSQS
ncbi:hypothetical protein [Erythrobacter sp. THAF29]|uniref:hypothetical protein n=1 Tax=Erythrobacter sp. THAF29 TaxID=2587851 RepID=UPI001268443B|nr:hypothetical protein [Erythrobacter sp. THAF29]QFT78882.1 hypothetical protein FIU90_15140 [Erythrobacter sp. THAF29]